ncbi:MAG: hypothetical protein JGK17_32165, partial [Microcoleus sp. PH2017_10_PVI_O_A]|uniref:hypothetical protein n=1 Tax=unclassified Microcoleus TaxID=2642155 RepID=UPI001D4A16D0
MFSLRVVLPVYKLNEWRNLQTSGEIIATWTGDDLLNGDEVIKKQAAQWLEKQQSESQIVSDYNELLDSKTKVERALRQVQRELKLNQSKLDLLKKFFAGLGFEPDSEYLK